MSALQTRMLGRTGHRVTALGYGAMGLRGEPYGRHLEEAEAARLLNAVVDFGINLIDTSVDYGSSEEHIGRYLSMRRDEFFLATKCGCVVGSRLAGVGPGTHDFRRENIVAGVEQSLRRLRTDHLDLVQLHASPSMATLREHDVLETLEGLRAAGKIRFIGMSSTLPDLEDHVELGVFDAFQLPYSALELEHGAWITRAAETGAGVLVRGGAAKGAPAGNERPTSRPMPRLSDAWSRTGLEGLLEGMAPMEFILRFTLSHPDLSTTIVGTTNLDHLQVNVAAAAKGPLPNELYQAALARLTSSD